MSDPVPRTIGLGGVVVAGSCRAANGGGLRSRASVVLGIGREQKPGDVLREPQENLPRTLQRQLSEGG